MLKIPHETKDVKMCTGQIWTRDPVISSPTLSPLDQRLQLPNRRKIFGIYALTLLTLLMYTVASPDPDPDPNRRGGGGGQLPNPNECNSTLTSETRGIYLHRYILMLMSGVSGVTAYVFSTRCAARILKRSDPPHKGLKIRDHVTIPPKFSPPRFHP